MTNDSALRTTPTEIMEQYGLGKDAYYFRLKKANIKAQKDETGKAYLDEEQLKRFDEVHHQIEAEKSGSSSEIVKKESHELELKAYQSTDDKIKESVKGDADIAQKFDRAAQTRAAAILTEAANRLTADYIANPEALDEDLKTQVFFEDSPQHINRQWAATHLAEAMKAQAQKSRSK